MDTSIRSTKSSYCPPFGMGRCDSRWLTFDVTTSTFSLRTFANGNTRSCWLRRCILVKVEQRSRLRRLELTILLGVNSFWSLAFCINVRMNRTCKLKAEDRALSLDSNIHLFFDEAGMTSLDVSIASSSSD